MTAALESQPDRVLVLESDATRASCLCSRLRYLDCEVTSAKVSDAIDALSESEWTAVMVGEISASKPLQALFSRLSRTRQHLPVLYMSDATESRALIETCEFDFTWRLEAPLRRAQLSAFLARARRYKRLQKDRRSQITGRSRRVCEVRTAIEQVADHDTTVLVTGESGTGKELVARTVHALSGRSSQPFVPINCGAIQPELLESELFGHEKGAFTSAVKARKGRFELARGGTLFLDEIGDMSATMQVKLLRVLQEKRFRPVGANKSIEADCRIIAATHKDLPACIEGGVFREDLYYRLNVFPIKMPPLRKRVADLPQLLQELMICQKADGEASVRLTDRALAALAAYPWPGNIRELSNLVERVAILSPDGRVDLEDLPEKYQRATAAHSERSRQDARPSMAEFAEASTAIGTGVDLKEILAGVEVRLIRQALQQAGGIVAEAARLLQMQRTTLVEKLKKYRLEADTTSKN